MNITIFGAGNMARAIAMRLLAGENSVAIFARNAEKSAALAKELSLAQSGGTIKTAALGSPISDAIVISTIPYVAAREVLAANAKQLNGKILVDITNVGNATFDGLSTPPDSSGAEELAKLVPGTKVLKGFNTTFGGLLKQGHVANQPLDVFIAGDDAEAKATFAKIVQASGMRPLDAGPLKLARYLEGIALINMRLQSALGNTWMTAIKIVA